MSTGSYAIPRRYALDLQERHTSCGLSFPLYQAYEWVDGIDAPPFWSPMTPTLNPIICQVPTAHGALRVSSIRLTCDMARHNRDVPARRRDPFLETHVMKLGSMCLKVRRSITSTTTGLKLKQAISCGYAAREDVLPGQFHTFCTKT
jgi:glyoxylate utilization-related uncharacterized protein